MEAPPDNIPSIFSSEVVKKLECGSSSPPTAGLVLYTRKFLSNLAFPHISQIPFRISTTPPPRPVLHPRPVIVHAQEPNPSSSNAFQALPSLYPLDPNGIFGYYANRLSERLFIQEKK